MAEAGYRNNQDRLNRMNPTAADAHMGDVVYDLINAHNDLRTKYEALLAHLDTANVAGIGNTNVTTYGPAIPAVLLPEQR